jgi:hypothetical protein
MEEAKEVLNPFHLPECGKENRKLHAERGGSGLEIGPLRNGSSCYEISLKCSAKLS